ncbi:hypothetical protein H072_6637 [Dactylellina haptotyla CBS 200.50]|uniref:Uncharacterized protein n=1 Tax=Dactylellina haptotyla (strain CBS 200.50) TaxID=1284197 RepID=S8A9L7_DACHA|nr:hypothetical protein H072_6637 [Dactylellina haptotyla CBS 200.50]
MKPSFILFTSALLSVGAMAAPHGWEYESSVAPVATTECDSATWTPYEYDSVPAESTVPYLPTEPAYYGPSSEAESTPAYYAPSSEPIETPVPSGPGYGTIPYYPQEEPTTTVTSTIDSTITVEVSITTYGPPPSSEPGYWTTVVTTSCPSSDVIPGYVPYTPTLTPAPYEYTTPASLYEPETPTPVEYPTTPVYYYPPGNETIPTPTDMMPGNNNTYYTPPPYAGSATSLVKNGGFTGMVVGLVGMVAVMGIF